MVSRLRHSVKSKQHNDPDSIEERRELETIEGEPHHGGWMKNTTTTRDYEELYLKLVDEDNKLWKVIFQTSAKPHIKPAIGALILFQENER